MNGWGKGGKAVLWQHEQKGQELKKDQNSYKDTKRIIIIIIVTIAVFIISIIIMRSLRFFFPNDKYLKIYISLSSSFLIITIIIIIPLWIAEVNASPTGSLFDRGVVGEQMGKDERRERQRERGRGCHEGLALKRKVMLEIFGFSL